MRINSGVTGHKPNPLRRRASLAATALAETAPAGPNPGNLRMLTFVPSGLKPGAALVVTLHGCTQTAAGYDHGAGWSQLAAEQGFVILAPEQKALNNPNTCFNWFNSGDVTRGEGEVASIAAMIAQMLEMHGLDPRRVFVTGLSAGGAMTAAMLATYPELFAGGAIIAGLPYGAAKDVMAAFDVMRSAPLKTPREWGHLVRAASHHRGAWPNVSIWHGDLDTTVNVNNAMASAAQWADLHGLKLTDAKQDRVDGAVHLRWGDALEVYTIPGMGHGTPIDPAEIGKPAPFILDVGISSTTRIAQFWGLARTAPVAKPKPAPVRIVKPVVDVLPKIEAALAPSIPPPIHLQREHIIVRALKAAGLMRKQ